MTDPNMNNSPEDSAAGRSDEPETGWPLDALVTAYALGELDEPALIARAEQALQADSTLRAEFDQTRHVAGSLRDALTGDGGPMLHEAQRAAVTNGSVGDMHGEARGPDVIKTPVSIWILRWGGIGALAAAACLLLMVNLPGQVGDTPDNVAIQSEVESARKAGEKDDLYFSSPELELEEALDVHVVGDKAVDDRPSAPSSGPGRRESATREMTLGTTGIVESPADWPVGASRDNTFVVRDRGDGAAPEPSSPAPASVPPPDWDAVRQRVLDMSAIGARRDGGGSAGHSLRSSTAAGRDIGAGLESTSALGGSGRDESDASDPGRPHDPGAVEQLLHRKVEGLDAAQSQGGVSEEEVVRLGLEIEALKKRLDRDREGSLQTAGESYSHVIDNPFVDTAVESQSTFAVDVDTASYALFRDTISRGHVPPPGMVRIEEMLNYFDYALAPPAADSEAPFAVHMEANDAPWNAGNRLVMIGLKGRVVEADMRPATNLVFLIDVSGSMKAANKLPLLKSSLVTLVNRLTPDDRISIVTYSDTARLVLPGTYCHERAVIVNAINGLRAGGSTNGGAGLDLAYEQAATYFIEGGMNRVILATDGDFNVGIAADSDIVRLIEARRDTGVFLNVLGFGRGNFKDRKLEELSNHGNGTFAFIDTPAEAQKTLVDDLSGMLVTIAKDVKSQVEFNPAKVKAYRLIGYENRVLANRQFRDDAVDAGEIGAGHEVIALYEIVPRAADDPVDVAEADNRAFQRMQLVDSDDLVVARLRWKQPDGDVATEMSERLRDVNGTLEAASDEFTFAAAVASVGMILRESPYKGDATLDLALTLVQQSEPDESREAFAELVRRLQSLISSQ